MQRPLPQKKFHVPQFDEETIANLKPDPLVSFSTEFDWDEVGRRLDSSAEDLTERDQVALAQALHEIIRWLVDVDYKRKCFDRFIGRRAVALAWTLCPELFDGQSMTKLSKRLGVTNAAMSIYSAKVRREFKVWNRFQSHGWNFNPVLHTKTLPARKHCSPVKASPRRRRPGAVRGSKRPCMAKPGRTPRDKEMIPT